MSDLKRKIGVRIGFVALGSACYFGTMLLFAIFPSAIEQAGAWDALEWLLIVLGGSILGDTVRPSGSTTSILGVGLPSKDGNE